MLVFNIAVTSRVSAAYQYNLNHHFPGTSNLLIKNGDPTSYVIHHHTNVLPPSDYDLEYIDGTVPTETGKPGNENGHGKVMEQEQLAKSHGILCSVMEFY